MSASPNSNVFTGIQGNGLSKSIKSMGDNNFGRRFSNEEMPKQVQETLFIMDCQLLGLMSN